MPASHVHISPLAWFLFRPSNPPYFYVLLAMGWVALDSLLWVWGVTLPNEWRIGDSIWRIPIAEDALVFIAVPAIGIISTNLAVRGSYKDWANLTQSTPNNSEGPHKKTFEFSSQYILSWSLIGALLATIHLSSTGELQNSFSNMVPAKVFLLAHVYFEWIIFLQITGIFIRICNGFNRLGKSITPNLVQLQALSPFSNVGLRMIAALCGIFISTLLVMDFDFLFFVVPFAAVFLVSLIIFVLPQLGIRTKIKKVKYETQRNLEEKILAIGLPGTETGMDANLRRNVAELITVRNMVAAYPDWPISSSNAIRLGLYLLLPLFSWGVTYLLNQYLG